MKLIFHRNFERSYAGLPAAERKKCDARLTVFFAEPFDPILHNHLLHGSYAGYRSINMAGDLRAIYKEIEDDTFYFVALGTHDKLYR